METVEYAPHVRARAGEEVWETTTSGRVWVEVTNERGQPRAVSAGGRTGARLRITVEDRELVQERIINREQDPFVNGMLVRVDADQQADPRTKSPDALNTEQLMKVFSKTGKTFNSMVDSFSEVTVRRMLEMAEDVDATNSQISYLRQVIDDRYHIGGDTPTYREMQGEPR